MGRSLLILLAGLALCSCAVPGGRPTHLDAAGVGIASRMNGDGARTGMTLAYWTAGYRGWGSFAKMRFDGVTGLDFLFDSPSQSERYVYDDPYVADHVGAVVFDVGAVYRFADHFAAYGGIGIGNLYEYDGVRDRNGYWNRKVHSLEWSENLTGGILWLWGGSGAGMDFGYDSFDESWRIGLIVNYGGSGDNWLD